MQQVIIVGVGQVSLTLAAELARFGARVRIIDCSPRLPRSGTWPPRTIRKRCWRSCA